MTTANKETYLSLARNKDFERLVNEATEQALWHMQRDIEKDVKLRYLTHIFSKTLDKAAKILDKSQFLN